MKFKRLHILCAAFLSLASAAEMKTYAQQQTLVDATLDSASIMIGQQTVLHLTVTADKGKQIIIPLPAEKLMDGIEVLAVSPPDTVDIKNNRIEIRRDLLITSFDSSLYLLPEFIAIDGRDTLRSKQMALKVSTPEVNIDKPDEYYDIKGVWSPPFFLSDYYDLIYGVLFTLFIICVIGYFVQRMRNKKPLLASAKEEPKLPPYEQAIKELEEIKERKLWQRGLNKEYYTEITDTLRRYISSRYGVSAMEKTSSEILDIIKDEEPGNKEVRATLKQILQLSDYVKFAKLHPLPDENDLSMANANMFVEQTKPAVATSVDGAANGGSTQGSDETPAPKKTQPADGDDEDEMMRYAPKSNDKD